VRNLCYCRVVAQSIAIVHRVTVLDPLVGVIRKSVAVSMALLLSAYCTMMPQRISISTEIVRFLFSQPPHLLYNSIAAQYTSPVLLSQPPSWSVY